MLNAYTLSTTFSFASCLLKQIVLIISSLFSVARSATRLCNKEKGDSVSPAEFLNAPNQFVYSAVRVNPWVLGVRFQFVYPHHFNLHYSFPPMQRKNRPPGRLPGKLERWGRIRTAAFWLVTKRATTTPPAHILFLSGPLRVRYPFLFHQLTQPFIVFIQYIYIPIFRVGQLGAPPSFF